MEFPGGKFIGIRKGIPVRDLLDELVQVRFTGYCIISQGKESGSLVLKNGNSILAEYGDLCGNAAWNAIQNLHGQYIDAQLMELSPAKFDLTLEFNRYALIEEQKRKRGGRIRQKPPQGEPPGKVEPVAPVRLPVDERESWLTGTTGMVRPGSAAGGDQAGGTSPGTTAESRLAAAGPPAIPDAGGEKSPWENPGSPVEGQGVALPGKVVIAPSRGASTVITRVRQDETLEEPVRPAMAGIAYNDKQEMKYEELEAPDQGFIRELSVLEGKDFRDMKEKIREDCRVILQGLHLEHLLEQEDNSTKE